MYIYNIYNHYNVVKYRSYPDAMFSSYNITISISQTISHACYARFVRLGHMVKHARWAAFHYFGVISTKWDENHMKPHRKRITKVLRNLLNFR